MVVICGDDFTVTIVGQGMNIYSENDHFINDLQLCSRGICPVHFRTCTDVIILRHTVKAIHTE